jgi:hypothetical protein
MKVLNPLKAPFGKARFSRIKDVSYLQWEDAFEVEFDDGLAFLEPHKTIRAANKIVSSATVERVERDDDLRHGFFIHYNNGQTAEVSWAFIRELPPKNPSESSRPGAAKTIAVGPRPLVLREAPAQYGRKKSRAKA